ncbi:hypothetical protein ACM3VC_005336 [Escherichia coli]
MAGTSLPWTAETCCGRFSPRKVHSGETGRRGGGGDWRVRQQLPVGVGPDDRMPPGSREPKVSVRQEVA